MKKKGAGQPVKRDLEAVMIANRDAAERIMAKADEYGNEALAVTWARRILAGKE